MKNKLITFCLCLLGALPLAGQTARLYTPDSGLDNTQINRIRQDRDGILWICSEGGLVRFDGQGFETLRHDRENPNSISSESVHDFYEDSQGVIWVATAEGLDIFDADYNSFSRFDLQDPRRPISNQFIVQLLEIPDRVAGSHLFVASGGNGIYVIDVQQQRLLPEKREKLYKHLTTEYIQILFLDAARHLWIVQEGGAPLVVLDADTLEPATDIRLSPELQKLDGKLRVVDIAEDPLTHNLLIATASEGLLIYEAESRILRKTRGRNASGTTAAAVLFNTQPLPENTRDFLIGSEKGGLLLFDTETESVRPGHLPGLRMDIMRRKANVMFEDNQGNIWLGLYQTGLLVAPKSMFGFSYFGFNRPGVTNDEGACVMTIFADDNELWVGTDGAGLYCQLNDGTLLNYRQENSELGSDSVMALVRDKRGVLWIGTYTDGLYYLDTHAGGPVRRFPQNDRIGTERIRRLAYDEQRDQLYVGTYGAGVVLVDPVRKAITGSVLNEDNRWVSALHLAGGIVWIGTYNGPQCYTPDTGQLRSFNILPDGAPLRTYAICSDTDRSVWFGTGEGLYHVSADGKTVRQYTERDGLVHNNVRDILPGAPGELWISTANGLSRFLPATETFTNYHASDGLQGNEFRSGAAFHSAHSDRLAFGGTGGVTYFWPQMVDGGAHAMPQVYLSHLTLLDREVQYDPELGRNNLIDKHLPEATRILVPNTVDLFSVEFSVPEYTNPQRIVYSYRLRGYDSDWKTAPARLRTATYTNVPPGRYQLEVRAFFEGAPDAYSSRTVFLRVEAPWYKKGGAYVFYFILFVLLAGLLTGLWKQKKEREREAQDAELKELRLGLFTNLTHEIRTPLTLVMGPLRTLRENEQDHTRKDTYNLMYRNCLRINRLVDQVMDLRKVDAGQMQMHFRQTDLIYFIQDIMQSFQNLAQSKRIHFSLVPAHDEEPVWIDQGNFDKIIYNILSNAFKHTPDGGQIRIDVSAPVANRGVLAPDIREYLEVDIFNSGSRIEEEYISRIFERFVQVNPYDASVGSGVGLNLTKMLVGLHHGQVFAENKADGVVFRVLVPTGKAHLSAVELSETTHHKDLYTKAPDMPEDEAFVQPDTEEQGHALKTRRSVVVVDDDPDTRKYLGSLLRSTYNVTECPDAAAAWPVITTTLPDAVLTDLVMPGMSGSELCARIRQNPAINHIPVLILTGQSGEQEQQAATDSGADKFLSKPISVELLLSSLAQAISARETMKGKFGGAMDYDYSAIKMGSADERLFRRIVESIQTHLEDPDFDVSALCQDVGISRVHLNRKLKENGNVPPSVLIKSFRMKQAAYLLAYNKVNVSEVAYRVGFSSHSYFSSSFRDFFGMTPREFVARYGDNPDEESLKKLFE